uniref:Amidase domain-containing protein n=1 Tax=Globodera pallida TaxID=36090 RepID=A0A183CRA3_GLOPA
VTWPPGGRVNESLDWSFEAIRMFRNESRNVLDVEGFPPKLVFSKGSVASSLSRKMAEFIVYELDLTETVRRLESGVNLGIDEILMPTLHAADALQAPGGFTRDCLERKKGPSQVQHITRAAIWYDVKKCGRLNSAIYADLPHVRFQKFAADLKKLNDAQRGTKDIIPFRNGTRILQLQFGVRYITFPLFIYSL